jgi:hypothetical protein
VGSSAQALPANALQDPVAPSGYRQRRRPGLDMKMQSRGVPHEAQQPRRIIDEARIVQHAEDAPFDVLDRAWRLHQAPPPRPG